MAFDPKPSTWLGGGYDVDTGAHTIIFNTDDAASNKLLVQLTDALADPTTGDIRSVVASIVEALYQAWVGQASADRPAKMVIARSALNGANNTVVFNYTFRFTVNPETFVVPAE